MEEFIKKIPKDSKDSNLYQWGTPYEKASKSRTQKVMASQIKNFGQVGLGSSARGREEDGDFIGGGEGFLFNSNNARITRGNKVFKADDEESYWTFQVADFSGARVVNMDGVILNGRQELLELLMQKSQGKPFMATFDAEFEGDFFARSNGIFPQDKVDNNKQVLFSENINGGHLVGGSNSKGDLESLKTIFENPEEIDFVLEIKSPIVIKPINEIKIAKENSDGFRKPRTKIEVSNAVEIIEKYRLITINSRE